MTAQGQDEREFIKRYDLKRTSARPCLRKVAGERCPEPHAHCGGCPFPGVHWNWWDHVRMYRTAGGGYALLTQPYDLDGDKLRALLEVAGHFDLDVTVLPQPGWWNEGTVGVVFTRRPADNEPRWMREATARLLAAGGAS